MRLAIPLVFFSLAAWFLLTSEPAGLPIPERVVVERAAFAATPVRVLPDEPTRIEIGSVEQRCNDCHRFVETRPGRLELRQHTDVVLDHGLNDRCLNCHSEEDREKLVLHGGELVGLDEPVRLCAKCHGPTWRDWSVGIHGRTNGFWDPSAGPQERLRCTDCHDPYVPAFDPLPPLPGPNTLRMGEPSGHGADRDGPFENPLDRWREALAPARSARSPAHSSEEGDSDG